MAIFLIFVAFLYPRFVLPQSSESALPLTKRVYRRLRIDVKNEKVVLIAVILDAYEKMVRVASADRHAGTFTSWLKNGDDRIRHARSET